jgi:hypothetical protein
MIDSMTKCLRSYLHRSSVGSGIPEVGETVRCRNSCDLLHRPALVIKPAPSSSSSRWRAGTTLQSRNDACTASAARISIHPRAKRGYGRR